MWAVSPVLLLFSKSVGRCKENASIHTSASSASRHHGDTRHESKLFLVFQRLHNIRYKRNGTFHRYCMAIPIVMVGKCEA